MGDKADGRATPFADEISWSCRLSDLGQKSPASAEGSWCLGPRVRLLPGGLDGSARWDMADARDVERVMMMEIDHEGKQGKKMDDPRMPRHPPRRLPVPFSTLHDSLTEKHAAAGRVIMVSKSQSSIAASTSPPPSPQTLCRPSHAHLYTRPPEHRSLPRKDPHRETKQNTNTMPARGSAEIRKYPLTTSTSPRLQHRYPHQHRPYSPSRP